MRYRAERRELGLQPSRGSRLVVLPLQTCIKCEIVLDVNIVRRYCNQLLGLCKISSQSRCVDSPEENLLDHQASFTY